MKASHISAAILDLEAFPRLEASGDFSDLTDLAAAVCGAPTARVGLGEEHVTAGVGIRLLSESKDARRLAEHPLVTQDPLIRSIAQVEVRTESGRALGALYVVDVVPREFSAVELKHLQVVARQVALRVERADLVRSHELLDGILRHSTAAIFAKDLGGKFLLANTQLHTLLSEGDGSLVGRSDGDLFPPDVAAEFRRNDEQVASSGRSQIFVEQVPIADGSVRHYQSTKYPLREEQGNVYAVAGVAIDVSELVEQRRSHAAAEQQWRAFLENSPMAIVLVDAEGIFQFGNFKAAEVYGVAAPQDLIGRSITEFAVTGEAERARIEQEWVLAGGSGRDIRGVVRRLNGELAQVAVNAARTETRGEAGILMGIRDITEQVEAERALIESERRSRAVIEHSPVGIGLADDGGRFVVVNAALCTLLGRAESEILGHSSAEFTHVDDQALHRDAGALIDASSDGVARIEKRYVRPNGDVRWAWLSITHTPGPAGEQWTLAHVQDVTERRASQQAIVDSEANLSAVAKVVKEIQTGGDARQTTVDAARDLAQSEYALLLEPSPDGTALRTTAATNPQFVGKQIPLDSSIPSVAAFRSGTPVLINDVSRNMKRKNPTLMTKSDWQIETEIQTSFVVPVLSGDSTSGVLAVSWTQDIRDLDDRRASAVALLADQAGLALRQAVLLNELESLARTDPLTGLPNRRGWEQHLELHLALARRRNSPLTVALADLDFFKRFNDTYGHLAGDALLREFAAMTLATLRGGDTVARWGGEEFAFALPDCSADEAHHALARVLAGVPRDQTCSIGYVTWDQSESSASLMLRADHALYGAKRSGRNRTVGA